MPETHPATTPEASNASSTIAPEATSIQDVTNAKEAPNASSTTTQDVSFAPEEHEALNIYEQYFTTTSENIHRYMLKNYNLNVDKRFIITTLKAIFVDSTHSIKDPVLFSQTNTIFKLVFQMTVLELIKKVNLDESVDVVDNTSKYIKHLEKEIKENNELIDELRGSYIRIKRDIDTILARKY
jgi:hypothetical protein